MPSIKDLELMVNAAEVRGSIFCPSPTGEIIMVTPPMKCEHKNIHMPKIGKTYSMDDISYVLRDFPDPHQFVRVYAAGKNLIGIYIYDPSKATEWDTENCYPSLVDTLTNGRQYFAPLNPMVPPIWRPWGGETKKIKEQEEKQDGS